MLELFNKNRIESKLKQHPLDVEVIRGAKEIFSRWNSFLKNDFKSETQIDITFCNEIFGDILGYTYKRGEPETNVEIKEKTELDGQKPDGILGFFNEKDKDVRVIIELKDSKTNLDKPQNRTGDKRTPVAQAFGYVSKYQGVEWVIVSNFKEIRLYQADYAGRYHSFTIEELANDDNKIKEFHFLLSKERLFTKIPKQSPVHSLDTTEKGEEIEKRFYKHYSTLREEIWHNLLELNQEKHYGRNFYLYKAQKLIDRIIFIRFCRENGALDNDAVLEALNNKYIKGKYNRMKALFTAMDEGNPEIGISKFNGGLFATDPDLDCLTISDEIIDKIVILYAHDFGSDLDVNILGHIFEQSISDLENLTGDNEKKRKKDGVFYTPAYITEYIVKEAIGGWLADRKAEIKAKENSKDWWKEYAQRLKSIKVLDPACGSGAFLVKVFDYLQNEWQEVEKHIKTDWTYKDILTHNIYGVDINPASTGITKLSLWLKTAHYREPLTTLDNNIKIGNSLIDRVDIAGYYSEFEGKVIQEVIAKDLFNASELERLTRDGVKKSLAFKWNEEFSGVFNKTSHLTGEVDSKSRVRVSDKFITRSRELRKNQTEAEKKFWNAVRNNQLGFKFRRQHSIDNKYIADFACLEKRLIIEIDGGQHCENKYDEKRDKYLIQEGFTVLRFWNNEILKNIDGCVEVVLHELSHPHPTSPVKGEESLGFDVIVGNPPYGAGLDEQTKVYLRQKYQELEFKIDSYVAFISQATKLANANANIGFIVPNTMLDNFYCTKIRKLLINAKQIKEIIDLNDKVFEGAVVHSMILAFANNAKGILEIKTKTAIDSEVKLLSIIDIKTDENYSINLRNIEHLALLGKLEANCKKLQEVLDVRQAIKTGNDDKYIINKKIDENFKPILAGKNINRYLVENSNLFVSYGDFLACPRSPKIFEQPKILIRETGDRIIATYDDNNFYIMSSLYNCISKDDNYNLLYLLSLLNSGLFNFIMKLLCFDKTAGAFTKARIFHYYNLPIKIIPLTKQQPFVEKAQKMLDLTKQFKELSNKFTKLLSADLGVKKITKKLQKWYNLQADEFFAESSKQNKNLSLSQKSQWLEHFETEKQNALVLQNQITKTDAEIDKMVYALYGLTDEEIKIIENQL